jgi:peroxiredoxin
MSVFKQLAVCGVILSLFMLSACGGESPAPQGENEGAGAPASTASPKGMSPLPGVGATPELTPKPRSAPDAPAPLWELQDVDGKTVRLADKVGKKGILMVFFATWCPNCMAEVPRLIEFTEKNKGRPVEVIGIAVQQPPHTIRQFVKARGVNYTVVLDPAGAVAMEYGVTGIPVNVGIDGSKAIIYEEHILPDDMNELARQLMTGIEGGPPAPPAR